MHITRRSFLAGASAVTLAVLLPRPARAATLDGTFPVTISTPGKYILTANQTVSLATQPAIAVAASDVEIDLQGFVIENTYGDATGSIGVLSRTAQRVHIVNGEFRGFYGAALLDDSSGDTFGHLISGVTARNCKALGFMVSGNGCVVSNSTIINPGGSLRFASQTACSAAIGICITRSHGCLLKNNTLSFSDGGATAGTVGIYIHALVSDAVVLGNTVNGADHALVFAAEATGEFRDNLFGGANLLLPAVGGRDIGNNQVLVEIL